MDKDDVWLIVCGILVSMLAVIIAYQIVHLDNKPGPIINYPVLGDKHD